MPNAGYQRRKIVHSANEHDTDRDPEQRRQPTKHHASDDRTRDRPCRRNRREVLPEQIKPRCRNVIDTVFACDGRCRSRVVEVVLPDEVATVKDVAQRERNNHGQGNERHAPRAYSNPRYFVVCRVSLVARRIGLMLAWTWTDVNVDQKGLSYFRSACANLRAEFVHSPDQLATPT